MYDHSVINLLPLVLMLLAAVRLTRLVVYDKITMPLRAPLVAYSERHPRNKLADAIVYLIHCEWCTGFWASVAVVTPWLIWPGNRGLYAAYTILAIAEIAPRILIWEPRSR